MFARPKAGESEEDILKLQEEFLSKNPTPSAAVINKRKLGQGNDTRSGMYSRSEIWNDYRGARVYHVVCSC
jgi:hypothetical protein